MFVAGKDDYYQLSIRHTNKNKNSDKIVCPPARLDLSNIISSLYDIKCVSFGDTHGVFITKDGSAYGFGNNKNFKIGSEKRTTLKSFTKISFEPNYSIFDSAFCGDTYTLYLTVDGTLIFCSSESKKHHITIYHLDTRPVYISGGWEAPLAVGSEGDLYIFESNPSTKPKKITIDNEKIVYACRCDTEGYKFIVIVTLSGNVYGNGYLNHQNFEEFIIIDSLIDQKVKKVFGYSRHCLALTEDGRVFGCGLNWHGQLGTNDVIETEKFIEIRSFDENTKIVDCAVGNLHSAFVTDDGRLLTCGSNFYGQLMRCYAEDEEIKKPKETDFFEEMNEKVKITNVFTGAFSSCVITDVPLLNHSGYDYHLSNHENDSEIFKFHGIISEKDRIIANLKKKLKEKDKEIQRLREKLGES